MWLREKGNWGMWLGAKEVKGRNARRKRKEIGR